MKLCLLELLPVIKVDPHVQVVLQRKKPQCGCEALASHRHTYVGSFFEDPEDIKSLSLGTIGTLVKEEVSLTYYQGMGHKGLFKGLSASGAQMLEPSY